MNLRKWPVTSIGSRLADCHQARAGNSFPSHQSFCAPHIGLLEGSNAYVKTLSQDLSCTTWSVAMCPAFRLANHSSYEFTAKVTAHDTYEGLQKASDLFVAFTLSK